MPKHSIRTNKPYIGNRKTGEVHKASCPWAQLIKPANRVFFNSLKQAKHEGYDPGGHCLLGSKK